MLGDVAGGGLDAGGGGEILCAFGAEFGEFAGAGQQHLLEGADRFVVMAAGGVEALAHTREMFSKGGDAIVEFAAERADFFGVFRQRFLPPTVSGSFQQGDERGRRGEEDFAADGAVHD